FHTNLFLTDNSPFYYIKKSPLSHSKTGLESIWEFFRQRFSVLAANLGQDKEKSPIKGFLGCLHPP
ncbi:hypothetical protein, partial [Streptococcus pneumoniae]|uniref:hypothetical protein n=1 Tax=Streptococcus pneumoniae TaxID=1313 RepID=UPI001D023DF3